MELKERSCKESCFPLGSVVVNKIGRDLCLVEIVHEDGKWYEKWLPIRLPMEWISVKDRLPSPREQVLCCISDRHDAYQQFVARLCEDEGHWKGPRSFDIYIKKETVTHWMPLPEPANELD